MSYRNPDQLQQLMWVAAPSASRVNATAVVEVYDIRKSDRSTVPFPAIQSSLEYAELPGTIAEIYEVDSTPRVLAVDPDEGPSVGGVLTTITVDLGTVPIAGRTFIIEAIELVGSPCDLNAEPGTTGVLRSLEEYHGKRPGFDGKWVDPVSAKGNIYQIRCVTGSYNSGRVDSGHTGRGLVHVQTNLGLAAYSADATYRYIDYWSSPTTWTGGIPPREGQSVFSQLRRINPSV